MSFSVPDHVRVADVDGDLVFLDARRNLYACVARGAAITLRDPKASDDLDLSVRDMLEEDGLISRDAASLAWRPLVRPAPVCDFHDLAADRLPVTPAVLARLLAAAIGGWSQLILPRPERWLQRRRCAFPPIPATRAASLAAQFYRLRPLLPRSGKCLASSLILLGFLKAHGIDADWVFGVRTFPFDAHCWVEYEGVVLNDSAEHARWFTPIAVC